MNEQFSLSNIGFVYRLVVGNDDPEKEPDEERHNKQIATLNKCLSSVPKGKIIAQEKNFYLLNIGEHQVVMQYIVYHIGFAHKPYWIK